MPAVKNVGNILIQKKYQAKNSEKKNIFIIWFRIIIFLLLVRTIYIFLLASSKTKLFFVIIVTSNRPDVGLQTLKYKKTDREAYCFLERFTKLGQLRP
jgi:flagellar basal body-associated protein FliL